ncbi:insulinase family protein [bacterium]|nr:insulinase family protein [bacterium]
MKSLQFRKSVTPKGVRVVTETIPGSRSVALGIWVQAGSRDELPQQNGMSHFLEHMMFKGTNRFSSLQIARKIEQVGGYLNAYTSRDTTVYMAHLLDKHLPVAVDVLSDIVADSTFEEKEIVREKGVVLEEISGADDTPEDVVHDDFQLQMFPEHSLGLPILGSRETVSSFTRDELIEFWKRKYNCSNIVVAAAGSVDHEKLVQMISQKLGAPTGQRSERFLPDKMSNEAAEIVRHKDIVQAHVVLGVPGLPFNDERRYALILLNTLLGAGMSSRLFQRIREKNGLAYSIYSFQEVWEDCGMYGVYAGTETRQAKKAVRLIEQELDKLMQKPLSDAELKRTRDQLKGGFVLGLESISNRMNRLGKMEIYLNKFVSMDEFMHRIDAVTKEDIQGLAQDLFSQPIQKAFLLPG